MTLMHHDMEKWETVIAANVLKAREVAILSIVTVNF